MMVKSHNLWITDAKNDGIVRLHVAQFDDGTRAIGIDRGTLEIERKGSVWGADYEPLMIRLAEAFEMVAARIRDAAPRVQAVMDSAEVSMHPFERATGETISRYIRDKAEHLPPAERARMYALADEVYGGKWWGPR